MCGWSVGEVLHWPWAVKLHGDGRFNVFSATRLVAANET